MPVLCGTALRTKGIQLLLDAVVEYLPSPLDIPAVRGVHPVSGDPLERPPHPGAPTAAMLFKIQADPFIGRLGYVRVYSGVMSSGQMLVNANKDRKERMGRLVQVYAEKRQDVTEIRAGDIGAIVGIKQTFTGETLCDPDRPIILETIEFPAPVIAVAVEPKTKADQDKLSNALQRLAEEDPTFKVKQDEQTGQTLISGMGELHLEVLVERMRREFGVQAHVGRHQVAYRETISRKVTQETRYIRQTGGRGQYGHVIVELEPLERGKGFEFVDKVTGGAIPKEFIQPAAHGMRDALENGVVGGYPMVDVRATLVGGSYHEVDSFGDGVPDRRLDGDARGRGEGVAGVAGTGDAPRGGGSGGPHWRRDRRPRSATRANRGHGGPLDGVAGGTCDDPAGGDVRLCDESAFDDPRPRDVHDGV